MEPFESIHDWISRQPWSEAKRAAAIQLHDGRSQRLNPLTRGQWRTWSDRYDRVNGQGQ